jgi:hypothetical protein
MDLYATDAGRRNSAKSLGALAEYFELDIKRAKQIAAEVGKAVSNGGMRPPVMAFPSQR